MPITVVSNDPTADTQAMKPTEAAASEETTSAPGTEVVTEQNAAPESETVETEDEEGEEAATDSAANPDAKPRKKGGYQKRIDKLTREKTEAQMEAAALKVRLAEISAGSPKATETPSKPVVSTEGKPDPDKFSTHAEYVEALTDWKTEQKFAARDQKLEQARLLAERGTVMESYQNRAKEFAKKTPDFQAVIQEANGIQVSAAVREVIFSSENGPELAYELAKDKAEFARICAMSPLAAAVEMGALRNRLALKASISTTETKKPTSAPNPVNPVGRGGKAAVHKTPEEYAAAGDFQGYKRAEAARLKSLRR